MYMRLSDLQRYILLEAYQSNSEIGKARIGQFYSRRQAAPKPKDLVTIITRSVERLIERDLAVGFGKRTKEKWFIERVRLTPAGRRAARGLMGRQQQLPLHLKIKMLERKATGKN